MIDRQQAIVALPGAFHQGQGRETRPTVADIPARDDIEHTAQKDVSQCR